MDEKYSKALRKHKHKKNDTETQFICRYCGRTVNTSAPGTHQRNHCPWCLRSVHLDERTGDRTSSCGSIMEPIAISVRAKNEWIIIHRCTGCGALKGNRIAGDDNEMALLSLAVRPVAQPPFPLDGFNIEHADKEDHNENHQRKNERIT